MSRLAKKPIKVPEKVTVNLSNDALEVKGPLGSIKQTLNPSIKLEIMESKPSDGRSDGKQIQLKRLNNSKSSKSLHGLFAALVKNAIKGVVEGFSKELEIHGIGFNAILEGKKINFSVGFTHPVKLEIPDGLKVVVDPKQTLLTISGIDKYKVGQFAADIRSIKPPEPYKGTGIRYKGERIIKKAGKAAAGAAAGGTK